MQARHRPGSTPPPAHETQRRWRPSWRALALALIVAIGVPLGWLSMSGPTPLDAGPQARPMPPVAAGERAIPPGQPTGLAASAVRIAAVARPTAASAAVPSQSAARPREPDGDPTPDLSDYLNPGETPTMAEVIARLNAAGVTTGLGAFQPPGTRPPLVGLAVPDDYPLPAGYVRHYQATDDGRRIEPILMFSPDVQWVDAAGRPVELPADRVVPVELAPPGLPIRRIVVPAPAEPGK